MLSFLRVTLGVAISAAVAIPLAWALARGLRGARYLRRVSGDMQVVAACLASMVLLIVLVNRLFWDPLYQRVAARYKMEA